MPFVLLLGSPFFRHVNLVRDFCLVTGGAVPASTVGSPCGSFAGAAYTLASTKASTAVRTALTSAKAPADQIAFWSPLMVTDPKPSISAYPSIAKIWT